MKFCLYNVTTAIKIGGIETFYWEIANELIKQGHEVEIISGKGKNIIYNHIPIKMFKFTPREKFINLGNRFQKWAERISFFKNAYPYIKNQYYDVFLIHKPLDFFTAYFIKKYNPNIKTVFVSGGEDFYGFDKFFSKYVDIMISVSKENAKIISTRYKREVKVNPNGVNIEKFKPFNSNLFNNIKYTKLISIGRIVGWKGYQLIIKSLPQLKNYIYICIGEGEYLKELKKLAKELNVENKVFFIGSVKHQELPKYLNAADIFIQPSIGHEAFGITIIEAMACNKPVIASYNGGMKDIIEEGINGYFFEKNNIEDLIKKVELTNKNLLQFYPRKTIIKKFTWEKVAKNLLYFIKEK